MQFGHIEDIKVGDTFQSRRELADAGVHAPLMSGIWGAQEGAYSIVLSGGYEDDIDELQASWSSSLIPVGDNKREQDTFKELEDIREKIVNL